MLAANAILRNCGDITWRLQIGSSFLPAVPLALLIFFCKSESCPTDHASDTIGPESPRWYMRKGRMLDAYTAMRRLRKHDVQAARDLVSRRSSITTRAEALQFYAAVQWEAEKKIHGDKSILQRFTELFTIPRIRRATLAASVLHLGQDLCGINSEATMTCSWTSL